MIEFIQKDYFKLLNSQKIVDTDASNLTSQQMSLYLDKSIEQLNKIPEDKLGKALLSKIKTDFINIQRERELLSASDILRILNPELNLSADESDKITNFLALDTIGESNPTNGKIIRYILERIRNTKPIEITLSFCIGKTEEVRKNEMQSYLGLEKKINNNFFTGVEAKKIDELSQFVNDSGLDFDINIMLGDMDFWTIDNALAWLPVDLYENVYSEIDNIKSKFEVEIKSKYPNLKATVKKWSDLYNYSDYESSYIEALNSAKDWLTPNLQKQSIYPYFNSWGYDKFQRDFVISDEEIFKFISNDIIKTAGQYRLETNLSKGVIVWAESCASPLWPILISNFNNEGILPSISIV